MDSAQEAGEDQCRQWPRWTSACDKVSASASQDLGLVFWLVFKPKTGLWLARAP